MRALSSFYHALLMSGELKERKSLSIHTCPLPDFAHFQPANCVRESPMFDILIFATRRMLTRHIHRIRRWIRINTYALYKVLFKAYDSATNAVIFIVKVLATADLPTETATTPAKCCLATMKA